MSKLFAEINLLLPEHMNMHQALAWVRYRDANFASIVDPDALYAALLWPGDRKPIAGRDDLLSALASSKLVAEGELPGSEWEAIPSPQWAKLDVAPRNPARHAPYEQILVSRNQLLKVFPTPKVVRASHAQAVSRCRRWIDEGKGNGSDKAWPFFKDDPQHIGLSRETFRQAWNEAKGKLAS